MAEGFLGRWSQRKQALRSGQAVEEPTIPVVRPELVEGLVPQAERGLSQAQPERVEGAPSVQRQAPPPPTLQDAQALTPQSDFRRFVAADVDPEVKNAAMRKLFADPHFNVMDGLDIYIDDYNKPDPLPDSMLRQMASAQFLGLVEDENQKQPVRGTQSEPEMAPEPPAATEPPVAQQAAGSETPEETNEHDDPDLRLQQDHAAGPQGSGRGA